MKRVMILCAACLAWAGVAGAQTRFGDGNPLRSGAQAQLTGGELDADTTGRFDRHDSAGNKLVKEAAPLNEKLIPFATVYADTLSYNGRSLDSTSVTTDISNFRVVNLGLKLEQAWGAAAARYRIGVTCVMSHSSVASDTTLSFAIEPVMHTRETDAAPDSIGFMADGVATTNTVGSAIAGRETTVGLAAFSVVSIGYQATRTAVLTYYNPGFKYVRWKFRVLTEPVALDAGAGFRHVFKLRAVVGGRVL